MDFVVVIVSLILARIMHGEWLGKLLMFFAFMIVMCALFGAYIPFSKLISDVSKVASVMSMIFLGAGLIFVSGDNKNGSND